MDLKPYSTAQLITAFNAHTGRDLKRFESRSIAEARVGALIRDCGLDLDAVLGADCEAAKTKEPAVAKPTHAADAAAAAIVAGAKSYNVHMRLSPTSKINEEAMTLAEAGRIAIRLEETHPNKKAMVYEIGATGAAALVLSKAVRAAVEAANAKPLDQLGDLSSQGTGIDQKPVKAGHGEPLGDLIVETGIATDDEVPGFLRRGRVSGAVAEVVPEADPAPVKPVRGSKEKPAKTEGAATRTRRDAGAKIEAVVANPKKPGSKSFFRFELYKAGATIGEFIAACVEAGYPESEAKADISWDSRKGFIKIADAA